MRKNLRISPRYAVYQVVLGMPFFPALNLVAVGCSTGGAIIRTYISARALARRDALASVAALGGEQPPDAVGDVMSGHGFDAFATFYSG